MVWFIMLLSQVICRAYKTCEIIKSELDNKDIDFSIKRLENLNERDYGDLTGLNKKETAEKYGEEQVQLWRQVLMLGHQMAKI